jgi:2-(1,2-epoxy-1,2-dihydrophenyl)acetyl-CoA isomerase
MTTPDPSTDLHVAFDPQTHVATVEIRRPPNNYFDVGLLRRIADRFEELDADGRCRVIVLCSAGKHFCAGRDFESPRDEGDEATEVYDQAVRLVATPLPWIAAVQGAAIGGGLGLAMAADLRIAGSRAWFTANFARLGIHHGFGLGVTLPPIIGQQRTVDLLYTGRRVRAEEAAEIGLVDRLVAEGDERVEAARVAADIAASAPLAIRSIRETLRGDLVERFRAATTREAAEQVRLRATADHREGVAAVTERRDPVFTGL